MDLYFDNPETGLRSKRFGRQGGSNDVSVKVFYRTVYK